MSYTRFALGLRRFLNRPDKVAFACCFVFVISIFINGNIWRLWSLHRDLDHINTEIMQAQEATTSLQAHLKQAKDPAFIERQARDKLDLAGENDLVFIFSDQ